MMKTHENEKINVVDDHRSVLTRKSKTRIEGILRAEPDANLMDEEIRFVLQTMKEIRETGELRQEIESKVRRFEIRTKMV
jgi:hypothetical protein